jgi:integrase
MATISFHLKRPGADEPTAIFVMLYANGKQTKIYTGETIHPAQWDKDDQKAKTRNRTENDTLNKNLARMGKQVLEFYRESVANGVVPTTAQLRAAMEPAAAVETAAPLALYEVFGEWIEQARQQGRDRSAIAYETARTRLFEFGSYAKMPVSFEGLTLPFFDKYVGWMLTRLHLTDNTVAKHLSNLKTFLKWATERGYNENLAFKRASHARRDPAVIALNSDELRLIEQVDLTAVPHLDNARALFLLMCYTGLRYSDLEALRPEHDRGAHLDITAQKTGRPAKPPIRRKTRELLTQLFAGNIHVVTNQKLNNYVKEVARLAGIDAATETLEFRGGKRNANYAPKWELIGCHTGRRTFVTLALMAGVNQFTIMRATGHTDMKSFVRYVDYSERNVVDEFARLDEAENEPTSPATGAGERSLMRVA